MQGSLLLLGGWSSEWVLCLVLLLSGLQELFLLQSIYLVID